MIWDCSWTNILSKKNWFPLLDAGAESRKFSPNARGPGDRNPSLFLPETSEKCSNCHTEGFFFSIDRWKKERKVGGCRNSALRCHFKGKKSSYCTLTGCSSSLQKSEGETTLFSKNYWTMRAFPDKATKILTDNETETFLDQMIWFWVFLRLNLFMLRPILFIREQIIQCHCRNFFVYSQSNMKWRIYERNPDKHQSKYYDTKKETFSLAKFSEMGTFFLRPTLSIPILRPFLLNCWLLITMDNAPLHLCSSHHRNQWFSEARLDACYRQHRAAGRYSTTHDWNHATHKLLQHTAIRGV